MSEPRRTVPRLVSALLVSAAAAVLSVPVAQSVAPAQPARTTERAATADLYRGQQWTLRALHISRAWKYSRGNGVTVAVLDTGVDGHQADLTGRVIDGPDFTGHMRRPGNRYWGRHGTQMASIIAGHGHGPGGASGVIGVAPDAKILSIRVTWELNDPARNDRAQLDRSRDAIAKGIRYAADHGAQVISMSLGGGKLFYTGNPVEEAAIRYALNKGVVLVASAGNDGAGPNRRNYPAAYPGVIAVGAVDRSFRPARFTNHHTYVSVAAPGVEIVSADVSGHGYVLGTGTSSSAAFVAGISALVKARYPRLTPAEVKQALEQGATHKPPNGRSTRVGTGVADAFGALRAAAHINRAEHAGGGVTKPAPTTRPVTTPAKGGPDLMLIAVLSGGGTLIVLSLILGWRQRRRRAAHDAEEEADAAAAGTPSTGAGDSSWRPRDESPWRPRETDESPWRPRETDESPWRPRETGESPWEPRSADEPSWRPRPGDDARPARSPMVPGPLTPYEPPAASHTNGNGNGSKGHLPSDTRDFRVADRTEPLGGTQAPLAGETDDRTGDRDSFGGGPNPLTGGTDPYPSGTDPYPSGTDPYSSGTDPYSSGTDPYPGGTDPYAEPRSPAADPHGTGPMPISREGEGSSWDIGADPLGQSEGPRGGTGPRPVWEREGSSGGTGSDPLWGTPRDPRGTGPMPVARETGGPSANRDPLGTGPNPLTGGSDPLNDEMIESSPDIGTPLADESWESIRRGFDRLKEKTSNWDSLSKEDFTLTGRFPAAKDPDDDTSAGPGARPDDDEKP